MYKHTCTVCGKEFEDYLKPTYNEDGTLRPRFCCKEHYYEYHKADKRKYVCQCCGKEFESTRHYGTRKKELKGRFCSRECYFKFVKDNHSLNHPDGRSLNHSCPNCGKKFHLPKGYQNDGSLHFCSISCSSKYYMNIKMKPIRENLNCTCAHCGKKFHRKPSAVGILNFCTQECKFAYHKARRVKKVCLTCGKEFDVTPDKAKRAKFCSVACHDEYQRRFFIDTKCAYCGKSLRVSLTTQHHNKTGQYFCSNKCVGRYFQRENNPNYKGTADVFKVLRMYYGQYQRQKIFVRDNKVCQVCGGVADNVHHIYPIYKMINDFEANHPDIDLTKNCYQVADMIIKEHPKFLDLENMIAVCEDCHKALHKEERERRWQ